MKTENLLLLAVAGLAIYYFFFKKDGLPDWGGGGGGGGGGTPIIPQQPTQDNTIPYTGPPIITQRTLPGITYNDPRNTVIVPAGTKQKGVTVIPSYQTWKPQGKGPTIMKPQAPLNIKTVFGKPIIPKLTRSYAAKMVTTSKKVHPFIMAQANRGRL